MNQPIYLDHAAATPLDPAVLKAMQPYFTDKFYNPSALYLAAKDVSQDLSAARASVASHLGARPAEIIFTAGGTEANNLAIRGIMQQHPDAKIVVSAIEHESVLEPARTYNCTESSVHPDGRIDLDNLRSQIDDQTVLVSIMYANNEIGIIEPLREIAKLVAEERAKRARQLPTSNVQLPIYLHTDAAQAANYLDLHVSRLGVDLMTLNGGKIYGPKQSGALYVKSGVKLSPQLLGGGQEMGLRSGTENVAASIGFATALDIAQTKRSDESRRLAGLQKQFFDLLEQKIPNIQINGSQKHRLPNNVHITIPGQDNERLIMSLDQVGIQAATGSACSASSDEPSHVLRAAGLTETDARSSLRITTGRRTDEHGVRYAAEKLSELVV